MRITSNEIRRVEPISKIDKDKKEEDSFQKILAKLRDKK